VEIMTMLKVARCYRITLMLDISSSTGGNAPVQAVVQSMCENSYCIAQITYEQAALLLVKAFREPTVIQDHMNTLVEYELVELCGAEDDPHLFSVHELTEVGIALDFKLGA
jgi:hypothetical protein